MLQSLLLPMLSGVAAGLAAALIFILLYTRNQRRSATGILSLARAEIDRLRARASGSESPSPISSSPPRWKRSSCGGARSQVQRRREEGSDWNAGRMSGRGFRRGSSKNLSPRAECPAPREDLNQREQNLRSREARPIASRRQRVKLERIAVSRRRMPGARSSSGPRTRREVRPRRWCEISGAGAPQRRSRCPADHLDGLQRLGAEQLRRAPSQRWPCRATR